MTTDRSRWRPLDGSPGFYVDDAGTLHVDEDEAIRASGHIPTPPSRRALRRAVRELEHFRFGLVVEEVDDD
jgi:hypothetical protein